MEFDNPAWLKSVAGEGVPLCLLAGFHYPCLDDCKKCDGDLGLIIPVHHKVPAKWICEECEHEIIIIEISGKHDRANRRGLVKRFLDANPLLLKDDKRTIINEILMGDTKH